MSRLAGSNVAAVKSAFVTALSARPAMSGVQVAYSTPARLERQAVFFDQARPTTHTMGVRVMTGASSASNPHLVREELSIPLTIQVEGGVSVAAADTAAVSLLVEVQQCLAEASQLVPSVMWVQLNGDQIWSAVNEQNRAVCRIDLTVDVMAELFEDA